MPYEAGQNLVTGLNALANASTAFLNPAVTAMQNAAGRNAPLSITGAGGSSIYNNGSFNMPGFSYDPGKVPIASSSYGSLIQPQDMFTNTQNYLQMLQPYLSNTFQQAYGNAEGGISGASRGFSGARKWAGQQAANATANVLPSYLNAVSPQITSAFNTPFQMGTQQAMNNANISANAINPYVDVYQSQLGALSGLANTGYQTQATSSNSLASALASLYGNVGSGMYGAGLGGYWDSINTAAQQQPQYNPG